MKTIICTHDSITAHPPRKWWMKLGKWIAVTQSKTIYQQYADGIRCFDLRVRLDKDNKWVMCHGLYEVEANFYEVIENLRDLAIADKSTIYIRIVLENLKINNHEAEKFKKLCECYIAVSIRQDYGNLALFISFNSKIILAHSCNSFINFVLLF